MKRHITFAVGVPILLGASLFLPRWAPKAESSAAQPVQDLIAAPTTWIPFDAPFTTSSQAGTVAGHFYRRSDGSTRTETGPENGPVKVISIKNISNSRYYTYLRGAWSSYHMRLPKEGFHPALRSLTKTEGLIPWPGEKIHGFELYRFSDRGGLERFQAPALNFFALRTVYEGTREEYFDIKVREQSPDLFLPPPGQPVDEKEELGGIIADLTPEESKSHLHERNLKRIGHR
jgi:hypothetical protein